ncbi:MAG: TRL domain-containing protein [Candidatus Gastranaerophilales bacterium]|nr:TRL domain-containing protein [Candidatus Gastranaerophilales bacterium]
MKKNLFTLMAVGVLLVNGTIAQAESIAPGPELSIYANNSYSGSVFGTLAETKRGCKTGKSTCKSYLGIVKTGSCGVGESIKNGNLSVLKYVDVYRTGWFFNRTTTINAYGD